MSQPKELSILLRPSLFMVCALLPQVVLIAGGWRVYSLVQSALDEEAIRAWTRVSVTLIGLLSGFLALAGQSIVQKRSLPWLFAPLYVVSYVGWIYLFVYSCSDLLPSTIPRWLLSAEDCLLAPGGLTMPGLLYAALIVVYRLTPEGSRGWPKFHRRSRRRSRLVHPFTVGTTNAPSSNLSSFLVTTSFAASAVAFTLLLLRWFAVLARKQSRLWQLCIRFLVGVFLPLLGLYIDRGMPYLGTTRLGLFQYGDFSHPAFAILALVNGIILMAPLPSRPSLSLTLYFLRCALFPFTLYFFLVFMPLLPLALLATCIGFGFLMLTPTALFVVHSHALWNQFIQLSTSFSKRRIHTSALVAVTILPAAIFGAFLYDRHVLQEALRSLKTPNYETGSGVSLDRERLNSLVSASFALQATPTLNVV